MARWLGFVDASVKALEINGIPPSAETVRNKTYPISRELYMFTDGKPKAASLCARFLELSTSEKGMEIVGEIGFVPVEKK
jgi:phosphate transport system substrate-binding protein